MGRRKKIVKKVEKASTEKISEGTIERGDYKSKNITPKFGDTTADIRFNDKENKPKFGI